MGEEQHGTAVRIPAARLFLTPSLIGGEHALLRSHAPMERCHVGSKVECWKSRLWGRADGPVSGRIREDPNIRLSEYAPLSEADPDGSGFGAQRCPDGRFAATGPCVAH